MLERPPWSIILNVILLIALGIIFWYAYQNTPTHRHTSPDVERLRWANKRLSEANDSLRHEISVLDSIGQENAGKRAKIDTIYISRYETIQNIDTNDLPDSAHAVLDRFIESRHIADED